MKKLLLVVISALLISNSGISAQAGPDYVITEEGTFYFSKVRYGFSGFLIAKNAQGERFVYNKNEVKAYHKNGRLFERKTLQNDRSELMELVAFRNGVAVYKSTAANPSGGEINDVFLYKGNRYVMNVTRKNLDYVLNFLNDKHFN